LQDGGLTRFRWCDNEPTLAFANWRNQINDPRRHVIGMVLSLQANLLRGEHWREVIKVESVASRLRVKAVDCINSQKSWVLLSAIRWSACPSEPVTSTQAKLASLLD
jgi:hypothetical protein